MVGGAHDDEGLTSSRAELAMRIVRFAIVASLGLPLAGCFGVAMPEKPVPDWALSPQAQDQADTTRSEPRKPRTARRTAPARYTDSERTLVTGEVSGTPQSSAPSSGPKPNSPEWLAQENARDAQLRRRMNICNGC
jgi:hypothetical protein